MKTAQEIVDIVNECQFEDWHFKVAFLDPEMCERLYLQVCVENGVDNTNGKAYAWKGRKWVLSFNMTETEIVKTALKAVMTAQEHETLEKFKYMGLAIFDPHIKVSDLRNIRICCDLDRRG